MNYVKFERRKDGEVAILPRAVYERLAAFFAHKGKRSRDWKQSDIRVIRRGLNRAEEDAGTRRIMDSARKALRDGSEALIPAKFSDRLQRGENPYRVIREMRGFSQATLATKAKISQPVLSQFERGQRTPSLATLKRLAVALAVPIATLTGETQRAWVASKVSTIKRAPAANRPRSGRRQAPAP